MSCTMSVQPTTIKNVFSQPFFEQIRQEFSDAVFTPIPLDKDVVMYAEQVDEELSSFIADIIEDKVGKRVRLLYCVARLNGPEMDESFRIHSDGNINGEQPDLASVFYLVNSSSGTALFEHEKLGRTSEEGLIFTEPSSEWAMYELSHGIENSMFIYDARCFHSRWPCASSSERIVITSFLKIEG